MQIIPTIKRVALCIVCSLFTIVVHAQQIPTNGLVAHWPFSGNANDAHGTHHGNPANVTLTQGKMGFNNTAYLFNSGNDYIGVPYQSDMNLPTISICVIFRPDAFYTGPCQGNFMLSRGSEGTSGSYISCFYDNPYNSCLALDTNLHVVHSPMGTTVLPVNTFQSNPKVHTGNWYCFVATYDGTTAKYYLNGSQILSFSGYTTAGASTDSICIGKNPWGGPSFPYNFAGAIDDIALYNRALTATEVDSYCTYAPLIGNTDTVVYINKPLNKTAFCPGDTVHINYKVTFPFRLNNTFTAQLSNAAGSFTSPVNIGSLVYNNDSVIICTIPANTTPGTGYRVRIVGSAPGDTSANNGVNLTVHPVPTPAISHNSPVCIGDTIQLIANYTGATFSWTGPGGYTSGTASVNRPNATAAMSGTYTVVTMANGCRDTSSIPVTVDASPAISITATDSLCALDTLFLTANSVPPANSYSWKSPVSSANTQQWIIPNMQAVQRGWYVVTATSINGCSSKDSVKIHVSEIPLELGDSFLLCNLTNRLTLNIPGASYLWQDSSTGNEYHITQSGTYYVTVNLNGCTKSDTVSGKIIAIGVSLGNDTSLCPGAIHQLSLADTFNAYNWNNGSTAPGINISEAGTYSVLVTKDKCTAADTVKVTYLDPWFDLGNDTILCNGERILLNPQSLPGSVYSWNNGTTGQVKEVTGAGLYIVAVENVCGIFSDTINIGFEECNCRPYIASAFSPNNDGHNDKISPRIFCPAGNYKFVIANRWGNVVFNTTNPLEKWDGTYKGTQADIGTYFYYYKITGPDGKEYNGKGDILLMR
ncbi:MAG: gliding motility-associated C-terminal domain-containing protein [Taibaiella sp.]|nr:gliding motility-associated C-terminal domain-containing protein [Taibaiella sp.]